MRASTELCSTVRSVPPLRLDALNTLVDSALGRRKCRNAGAMAHCDAPTYLYEFVPVHGTLYFESSALFVSVVVPAIREALASPPHRWSLPLARLPCLPWLGYPCAPSSTLSCTPRFATPLFNPPPVVLALAHCPSHHVPRTFGLVAASRVVSPAAMRELHAPWESSPAPVSIRYQHSHLGGLLATELCRTQPSPNGRIPMIAAESALCTFGPCR